MEDGAAILMLCAAAALGGCERPADAHGMPGAPPAAAAVTAAAQASPVVAAVAPAPSPPDPAAAAHAAAPAAAAAAPLAAAAHPAAAAPPAPAGPRDALTLIAGGDVCLGKSLGQALIREPAYDPFAPSAALLASADLRFVNLESQLSDQGGVTQHPKNPLVFVGPPVGADTLARARIDLVSLANNHMWDYGERAFVETLEHLERVGVTYVGAGRGHARAYGPVIVERDGFRVAMLAVTDIWNQGLLWSHPARERVAAADLNGVAITVRKLRQQPDIDAIVVSHHGGIEYDHRLMPFTRRLARAAIDAGADAFIGHHPHVIQGIEMRRGRPIFYSLGNYIMTMSGEHPGVDLGMLARLRLRRGAPPIAEVCPVRREGLEALPLAADPRRDATEAAFLQRLELARVSSAPALGPFGPDGCAPLEAAPTSAP